MKSTIYMAYQGSSPADWVFLDELCKKVHLDKRKRISMSTARNWLNALKLKSHPALCHDGKFRTAVTKEVAAEFLSAYRKKLAFHVVKK